MVNRWDYSLKNTGIINFDGSCNLEYHTRTILNSFNLKFYSYIYLISITVYEKLNNNTFINYKYFLEKKQYYILNVIR